MEHSCYTRYFLPRCLVNWPITIDGGEEVLSQTNSGPTQFIIQPQFLELFFPFSLGLMNGRVSRGGSPSLWYTRQAATYAGKKSGSSLWVRKAELDPLFVSVLFCACFPSELVEMIHSKKKKLCLKTLVLNQFLPHRSFRDVLPLWYGFLISCGRFCDLSPIIA